MISGPVATIAVVASTLAALEIIRRVALAPLWRFVRWLRHEVRDEIERRTLLDALINHELRPNGGGSMKDAATKTAAAVEHLTDKVAEISSAQHTTAVVLDRMVERRAVAERELWDALESVGVSRRERRR